MTNRKNSTLSYRRFKMKLFKAILVLVFVLINSKNLTAQTPESYSLSEVIEKALIENDLIQLQKIETQISENSAKKGNAGYLPSINLVSGFDYQSNSSDILLRTFQPNPSTVQFDGNGVESKTFTAAFQLDYTLFDGFAQKNRYEILKQGAEIANKQQEIIINSVILDVTELYFQLYNLQKQEGLLSEIVATSKDRTTKIQRSFELGSINGLTKLQAETNLNRDLLLLEEIKVARKNMRKDLGISGRFKS